MPIDNIPVIHIARKEDATQCEINPAKFSRQWADEGTITQSSLSEGLVVPEEFRSQPDRVGLCHLYNILFLAGTAPAMRR